MYTIMASMQIKEGHREEFIKALLDDVHGCLNDEPGCLRFDVIQDGAEPNKIWVYEVYKDEAAFEAHLQAPHLLKYQGIVKDWRDEGRQGTARGSYNIWPPDKEWK